MAKKILIIEDDTTLSENLGNTMKSGGYEVIVANDGETGFRHAQEKHPDLILMDLVLPKKHGFKIMEDLEQNPETKDIPKIVLTNLESPRGVKAYLVKANYSLSEILKKVQEVIEG